MKNTGHSTRWSFRLRGPHGLGLRFGKAFPSFDRNMAYSIMGLGCYLAWSFVFWSGSLSVGDGLPRGITGQGTVIQGSFSVLAALLLVCSASRLISLRRHVVFLGLFALIASFAVVAVFVLDAGEAAAPWRMVGLGLCGLGAVLRLAYNEHLSMQGVRRMAMCTGGAYLVGFVLHGAIFVLPLAVGIVVAALLPFAACGFLLTESRLPVLQRIAEVRLPASQNAGARAETQACDKIADRDVEPSGAGRQAAQTADASWPEVKLTGMEPNAFPLKVPESRVTLRELLSNVSWKLIAALVLTYFGYGVASALHASGGGLPLVEAAPLVRTGVYAGASFAAIFFGYLLYRKNAMVAFYIAFPLMAVVSLVPPSFDPLSIGPVLCVALIADVLWFLFIDTVIKDSRSALACVALMHIAQFGGGSLGQTVYGMVPTPEVASMVILVTLLGALLVIMSFVTQSKGARIFERSPEDRSANAGPGHLPPETSEGNIGALDDLTIRVNLICQTYGLTSREQEVLSVWATGRSAEHIAKMLSISKSTVKTHLNHIYTKTGATSREALFDLLDHITPTREQTPPNAPS